MNNNIKSTKTTIKFSNTGKLIKVNNLIEEYTSVIEQFVDLLWNFNNIPILLPKEYTSQINTWLSARMVQCAGKQASGIVRGTKKKQEKRIYIIKKLKSEGRYKKSRKLQRIYDNVNTSKPKIDNVCLELDSRFIKIDLDNSTNFDGWITITSIGDRQKIILPFKRNKHFNKLMKNGYLKGGVRLSRKDIVFMFDLPETQKRSNGGTLGIDIGQITTLSCSNNTVSKVNKHGHDLNSINTIMSRKKKGSKSFQKCVNHRKNYINWSINQLNLDNIKEVRIEKIKNLRRGRRTSRKLSHWTYTDIFSKLESYCNDSGVHLITVNPTYTSKRCSNCGWTRNGNRKGKEFECRNCNFTIDADLNAARNIAINLNPIWYEKRQQYNIKDGFYWNIVGQKPIVSVVQ